MLRARTKDAHDLVDAAVGGFDCEESYLRYLAGQYLFRRAVEDALAAVEWPETMDGWRPQPLADFIAADLSDLGLPTPPLFERVTLDPKEVLGVVYVLQGSTLGARLLVKRAREIGFHEHRGARHLFRQSQDHDGWTRFLGHLDAADPYDAERTVNAALATFALAGRAFERPLDVAV